MVIYDCKVNHLTDPLGYELGTPVFSWKVREATGTRQTAARLTLRCGGQTVADTGWADLDSRSAPLELPLMPRTRYTWTVAVRTDGGEQAESAENWFETAKLGEPWLGRWIGCPDRDQQGRHPVFSRAVTVRNKVVSARLYICGLGLYEAAWNGEKVGGEILAPYCNNYSSWVQYQTYDLTPQLQGDGVLSVTLGNGWYKGRFGFDPKKTQHYYGSEWKLIAELHLSYEDGTKDVVATGEDWQVTGSTITFSGIYDGERRDDTLPPLAPVPAALVEPPAGKLTARYSTPVRVREELSAALQITPAGETVLDIGQNQAGIFRLKVDLPKGARVRLQFGEILQGGNFYRDNLRTAKAEYCYISDGKPHILQPKFTYYGYRYVKVEGVPGLKAEDFVALTLYSELPQTGWLETGNRKVNQLISNTVWGQKSNFIDVPTDCPQRDERMGWTGDAQVFASTACYLRDSTAFFGKYLHDMQSEQAALGGKVPMVVPDFGIQDTAAAWGDAACVLPWTLYQFTGDRELLARFYSNMTMWLDYVATREGPDHGWAKQRHFGDWLALDAKDPQGMVGATDTGLITLWYYRHSLLLAARAARLLQKDEEAARWETQADALKSDLQAAWFEADGRCKVHTQTALLLALQDDLAPDRAVAADQLQKLLAESGGMLQTGFVGTPLLCPTLTALGREKDAFRLLLNEEYPGWLYEVNLGATTIWERWNSVGPDGQIAKNGMNSLNHYAYGSVVAWLFADVAGLAAAEPGFRRAKLAPHFCRELSHVSARYGSASGDWQTEWRILPDGRVAYRCTVPFGCTAQLCLPGGGTYELGPGTFEHVYQPDIPEVHPVRQG